MPRDWTKILAVILVLFLSAVFGVYIISSPLKSTVKIATICCIVAANAILLK